MKQIRLKNIEETISNMALGTMYFNTLVDGNSSKEILDYYFENGGNFIDTANMYVSWIDGFNGGESERIIGEWISERKNRDKLFISTKVGLPMKGVPAGLRKELIIQECENSLKRLNIDTIDLYFAHREDNETDLEETLEAFDILQRQGKIKHIGVSNHRSYRVAEANAISKLKGYPKFAFAQYKHTYLRTKLGTPFESIDDTRMHATEDLLDYVLENEINFMCYQTLLSGAYSNRNKNIPYEFLGPDSEERMRVLMEVTEETGATINQVVLSWSMNNKMKAIPLITGSSIEQIKENIEASNVKLTADQIKRLDLAGV